MNVHLFVLLQNTVPLPIPTFVKCRLLRMFQYADSSVTWVEFLWQSWWGRNALANGFHVKIGRFSVDTP